MELTVTATATETVVLPLGPPPHVLGGMVTQAIAAARCDEQGRVERAPALEREERVAVGSSVAWAKMTDVEELRDRGRAEATERKALAKRADTLERNQMTLEGQVKQLRAERDALRVDKAAAEKRERERPKQRGQSGARAQEAGNGTEGRDRNETIRSNHEKHGVGSMQA